jgi:hypothetical protein
MAASVAAGLGAGVPHGQVLDGSSTDFAPLARIVGTDAALSPKSNIAAFEAMPLLQRETILMEMYLAPGAALVVSNQGVGGSLGGIIWGRLF